MEEREMYSCRDSQGMAVVLPTNSPADSHLTLPPGLLPAMDAEYIFSVTVRKGSRTSLTASVNVLIVADAIPALAIGLPDSAFISDGLVVMNDDQRMIFTASSSINSTDYTWSVSPGVNVSLPGASPLGTSSSTFIFAAAFAQLVAGSQYTLELVGTTRDGAVGQAKMAFTVNSAPRGGSFSVCLQDPNQVEPGCIKEGQAVTQDFRLLAAGWTDADLPIMYEFGYTMRQIIAEPPAVGIIATTPPPTINGSNSSNASTVAVEIEPTVSQIWFEPVRDAVRDMGFPAGRVTLMCRVIDALGASTKILTDAINISSTVVTIGPGGRRLLAAGDFFASAKAKLSGALKTFRADKVNQLANSVATHTDGGGLGPVDAAGMKGALMASLQSGTGKAVKSTGFACESFGAGKSVTGNAGQLNGGAVSSAAGMLKSMVSGGLGQGGMDMSCASSAASMMVCVVFDLFDLFTWPCVILGLPLSPCNLERMYLSLR